MQRNWSEKFCESCGATYKPHSGSQRYCPKCQERDCDWCGEPLVVNSPNDSRRANRFCSRPCYWEAKKAEQKTKFWNHFDKSGECWLWTGYAPQGYGRVSIDGATQAVHRHALELTIGRKLEKGEYALHHCDTPGCGNPEHLYVGTPANNTADMMRRGRHHTGRGEARSQAKLTDEKVRDIRRRSANETHQVIADRHGVSRAAVAAVLSGRTWSHVT